MASAAKRKKLNYVKQLEDSRESLITCGLLLIHHVMEEYKNKQNMLRRHVNEILHSIFFLGVIYTGGLTPDQFLSATLAEGLRQEFPEPFEKYRSHLPKRTPFSILLDIMVLKYDTEEKVMEELRSLLKKLKFPYPLNKPGNKHQHVYTLESTVICISSNNMCPSKKYFGASLGCKTDKAKSIMIYSSCINTWHKYVSYSVMSFTHTQESEGLQFPGSMKCQAYLRNWQDNTYKEIPPCKNCKRIFSLQGEGTEQKFYPFGNCAETECLSKLLINDNFMQENTEIKNYTRENMSDLETKTINKLREKLVSIPSLTNMLNRDCLPVFNPDSGK